MTNTHTRRWQTEVLRGSLTMLFGVIFLLFHVNTLHILLYLLGGYLLADGCIDLFGIIRHRGFYRRVWLDGSISIGSIILGGISFVWPHITLYFLLSLLAIRLALRGASMLRQAWREHSAYTGFTWLAGLGLLLIGLLLLVLPFVTLFFLLVFIPVYAIGDGGNMLIRGLRLRFAPAIDHPQAIAEFVDLPVMPCCGVVFVRRGGASGLGHTGWAFEWPTGWFNVGAVENLASKRRASPDEMGFWTMHTLDPVAAMQQQLKPYDEYKVFFIANPQPKIAWKTVVWESRTTYSVIRHNCIDVVYDILRAYGVKTLLDPAEEFIPNDWYDALPGMSFAIAEHPVIPVGLHHTSSRLLTTTLSLTIPTHIAGTVPIWRAHGHRAWEEITLAWDKMLQDVRTLFRKTFYHRDNE